MLAVLLGKIYCKPSSWRTASSAVATDWVSKVCWFSEMLGDLAASWLNTLVKKQHLGSRI